MSKLPSNARRAFLRPANQRPLNGLTPSRIMGVALPVTIASTYSATAHICRILSLSTSPALRTSIRNLSNIAPATPTMVVRRILSGVLHAALLESRVQRLYPIPCALRLIIPSGLMQHAGLKRLNRLALARLVRSAFRCPLFLPAHPFHGPVFIKLETV